ncbi:MAG: NADPH:quinone oxidoreductase family protein [Sphingobium sp.]
MRAVMCEEYGEPDVLVVRERPDPVPGPGQVRVAMKAASLNFPDGLLVANRYQDTAPLPFVLGQEGAGLVDALGEGVSGLSVGDRVIVNGVRGTCAQYLLATPAQLFRFDASVPFADAASISVIYGTTIHALRTRGDLKPGETLLVLGAGGGVGSAAVQMGKLLGATVIAAASSAEKLVVAQACGADHLIDYSKDDLRDRLREIVGKDGVDVVYDPVCGPLAEPAFRSLGWNGRFLVIGFAAGITALPLNLPLLKGASVVGVFWGASIQREPENYRRDMDDLVRWMAQGKLRPHIGGRYSMDQAAQALTEMMSGNAKGKLVIEID